MEPMRKPRKPKIPIERASASAFYRDQWRRPRSRRVPLVLLPIIDRPIQLRDERRSIQYEMRNLAARLTIEHPSISTDPGIFGGNPHIKNVRLTVGNVLAKLYVYGNTKAIADIYAPHVSEAQIKEAIAYAQDFLEEAIHAHEAPEDHGGL